MFNGLVLVVAILAGALLACAQPPANFEESVRSAMAAGVAEQRAAVQQQAAFVSHAKSPATEDSFFTLPFPNPQAGMADCDALPGDQLDALSASAAQKAHVDPKLVRAVIDQESGGRPCAVLARGAQGLMQLMPDTASDLDVQDAFNPQQNVDAGAQLLRFLLDRYDNDASLALGAYNAGSLNVDQAGGVPPIPETMNYVTQILNKLNLLKPKDGPGSPSR